MPARAPVLRLAPTHLPRWLELAANLVPLAGVLWGGWSLFAVLTLYWLENAVVGAVALLRLLAAGWPRVRGALALFFVAHFGVFWIGHGAFVRALFADGRTVPLGPALASLAVGHLAGLVVWLRMGAWRDADPTWEMVRPYGRLMVLHVALLGGGWVVQLTGSPLGGLVLLVAGKTAMDLLAPGDDLAPAGGRVVRVPRREPGPGAS